MVYLDTLKIKYPSQFNSKGLNIYKDVVEPNFYSTNFYGDISIYNGHEVEYFKIPGLQFDFFQAISPNSIVVRSQYQNHSELNRSLSKLSLSDSVKVVKKYELPSLKDGIFANDGVLLYDRINKSILYMYFYRGEFIKLDTNLNLIYKSKTIDTIRSTKIKTGILSNRTKSGNMTSRLTQVTPPHFVNINVTTDSSFIYIRSKIKADNETQADFAQNNVIDVYNNKNGVYLYSFYIPKYNGQNLNAFRIHNKNIITKSGTFLVTYKIR